ncbi:MAG: glycosyltransferase [Pyrobaculum sp.]
MRIIHVYDGHAKNLGQYAFLVESADNSGELADRFLYLVERVDVREDMGKNSKKLAEEEFCWEKIAKRYIDTYSKLCGKYV